MGRRKKKKKKPGWIEVVEEPAKAKGPSVVALRPSSSSQPPDRTDSVAARIRDIRLAMERQSSKSALEKAKQLHKELGHEESKVLLIDAYVARIEAMLAKDLTTEARALADLVASRFPEAADRLSRLRRDLAAQAGDVAAVIGPLTDPELSPQKREETEQAIRQKLVDLQALATSAALPEDHPLRRAAAGIARAFAAVTAGDVDDAAVSLPEVSHRSPLAGWKSLIRAIACLYRGRDEACRRFLAAIEDDSAPARVADSIRSILAESTDAQLTQAGRNLVQRVLGSRVELRTALRALDEAFAQANTRDLYRQISRTVLLCERVCPQMLKRLKQHISVKAAVADHPVEPVIDALGGPSVHDAYFWRLFARGIEAVADPSHACVLWDRFRRAAIGEGLFAAEDQENAFLYLHMAELLRRIPPDHLRQMQDEYLDGLEDWDDFEDEDEFPPLHGSVHPDRKPDLYFLFPEQLYERAAALRSEAGIYKDWFDYVQTADRRDLRPDEVALKWFAAFPQDGRPLLHLAESAEQRDAFDKALRYIEQAERLGGIDPKVRRARFRLLVAKAVRHLNQNKLNLAAKDFIQIHELPQADEKDRPAFVASLRWVHAMLEGDQPRAERLHSQVRDLLGGPVAAAILLLSTARECGYSSPRTDGLEKWLSAYKERDVVSAAMRTCPIGEDVNIEILLPAKWESLLKKWLRRSDCQLDKAGLEIMAETALTTGWLEVAYYCCGYGLRGGGQQQGRFMFLRGRSLPYSADARRQECFSAALALAKRIRDADLVAEIVDASRQSTGPWGWSSPFGPDPADLNELGMDDENLKRVIEYERRVQKYPKDSLLSFFGAGRARSTAGQCQCPSCRRARGETGGYGESQRRKPKRQTRRARDERYLFDDLSEDDDLDEEFGGPGSDAEILGQARDAISEMSGFPPALVDLIVEIARRNGGRLPRGQKEINRLIGQHPDLKAKFQAAVLQFTLEEGVNPFDGFDLDEPGESEGQPPDRPYWPYGKGKRKKKR